MILYQILVHFLDDNPMFYEVKELFKSREEAERVSKDLPKLWKHVNFSNKFIKIVERSIYIEIKDRIDYNRYACLTPRKSYEI